MNVLWSCSAGKQLLAQKRKTGVRLFLLKNFFMNLRTLSFRKNFHWKGYGFPDTSKINPFIKGLGVFLINLLNWKNFQPATFETAKREDTQGTAAQDGQGGFKHILEAWIYNSLIFVNCESLHSSPLVLTDPQIFLQKAEFVWPGKLICGRLNCSHVHLKREIMDQALPPHSSYCIVSCPF